MKRDCDDQLGARMIRRGRSHDGGFTLIELLVVVIILGILAAIAIPAFMQHRARGWDSAVRADLRNAATAQETFLAAADPGPYATTIEELIGVGLRASPGHNYAGGTFNITLAAESSYRYCLTAQSASGTFFAFGSDTGWQATSTAIDPVTCG